MNIFFLPFTSPSLLPPIPDEVAGGLSGSSVNPVQRKCVTQQFSRELLSRKAALLLAHSGIRLLFPQRWDEDGDVQPPSMAKGLCILFSRTCFK